MKNFKARVVPVLATLGLLAVASCGGSVPGAPGIPGAGGSKVDPNTCGNYAASEAGARLKAFLEATVELQTAVQQSEDYLLDTCKTMGSELGLSGLDGNTQEVCNQVATALREHLQVGLKAGATLTVEYQPAVCTVSAEAAASAAAKCEGKAEADVGVTCSGSCSGTCQGTCDGTCSAKNASGECEGQCQGTCQGSCTGGCEGHADVDASASCEAHAEVQANVQAECTEPEVEVTIDAAAKIDATKVDAAMAALKAGMPRLLRAQAKVSGPLKATFTTWADSAQELAKSSGELMDSLGDQALCVSGQIKSAVAMIAGIQASIDVQIEVSASVSASAGAGGEASAG